MRTALAVIFVLACIVLLCVFAFAPFVTDFDDDAGKGE